MFFKKNKKEKNQKKDLHKKEENIDFDELEKNYQNELSNIKFNKLLNPENKEIVFGDVFSNENTSVNEDYELDFNNLKLKDRINFEKDPKKYREKEFKHARNVLKLASNDINKELLKCEKIDCKVGCSSCCNQLINIFPIEEIDILNEIENKMVSTKREIIKNQMYKWLKFYEKETPDRLLEQNDLEEFNKKLKIHKVPCPFLIENKCSIYNVRPLACKSFVSDDVNKCNTEEINNSLIHNEKYHILNEVAKENAMFLLKFKKRPFITRPLVLSFRDVFKLENVFKREINYNFFKK